MKQVNPAKVGFSARVSKSLDSMMVRSALVYLLGLCDSFLIAFVCVVVPKNQLLEIPTPDGYWPASSSALLLYHFLVSAINFPPGLYFYAAEGTSLEDKTDFAVLKTIVALSVSEIPLCVLFVSDHTNILTSTQCIHGSLIEYYEIRCCPL